jgi:pimeloyl-ACP methyl ester carboxylesterase
VLHGGPPRLGRSPGGKRLELAAGLDAQRRQRGQRPAQTRTLALFGISYGAMIAAAAAAMRDDLAAVVLESPPHSVRRAIMVQWELMGLPSRMTGPLAMRLGQRRARADFDEMRLAGFVEKIACPLMLVECGQDVFVADTERAEVSEAMERRRAAGQVTGVLFAADAPHAMAMQADAQRYASVVGQFLLLHAGGAPGLASR